MSAAFDALHEWLGIAPKDQPPHHYRLLAIEPFEDNANVIANAADRQMAHVRTFQAGRRADQSQQLLNHLAAARVCLLDVQKKAAYDAELKAAGVGKRPRHEDAAATFDGSVFGEYLLLDVLGRTTTGQVFKARQRTLDRSVALKILSAEAEKSAERLARFRRKARIMARFDHPHFVAAHDAGVRDGVHYLVMAYVDGQDLATLTRRFHPLPVAYVVNYITQAATGLAYAHSHGVLHRNVKPANLLVDQHGMVKVIGLGLAMLDDGAWSDNTPDTSRSPTLLGTLDYMPPEQIADCNRIDSRADIYSLGLTLYTALTGRLPYPQRSSQDKLQAQYNTPAPSLPEARAEVSESLDGVYRKMTAKRPAERFQSMRQVVAKLGAIQNDLVRRVGEPQEDGHPAELQDFFAWMDGR